MKNPQSLKQKLKIMKNLGNYLDARLSGRKKNQRELSNGMDSQHCSWLRLMAVSSEAKCRDCYQLAACYSDRVKPFSFPLKINFPTTRDEESILDQLQ